MSSSPVMLRREFLKKSAGGGTALVIGFYLPGKFEAPAALPPVEPAAVNAWVRIAPDDAVTLVRENGRLLPLKAVGTIKGGLPYMTLEETHNRFVVVVLSEDVRMDSGRMLGRQVRMRVPDANVLSVDPRIAEAMTDQILKAVDEAQAVVAAVYVAPAPGSTKNSVAVADATGALLSRLIEHAADKMAVVAMGNPYVVSDFPGIQNYLCSFSNATVSELSAVKALFGEIPIRGRLPVSIPKVAQRGAGIERPAQIAQGGTQHADTRIASE